MAESLEFIEETKEGESEIDMKKFVKKFSKMDPKDAKKLREKLSELNLLKLKQEYISKVIDVFPENQEDLNKIFTDVSLDEDESKKVLDTIKEFR